MDTDERGELSFPERAGGEGPGQRMGERGREGGRKKRPERAEGGGSREGMKRRVFSLAWPAILNNLFQTAAVTADIIMVGTLGRAAVAGVTLGGQLLFIVMTVFMAITSGTIALVARFTGSGDTENKDRAVAQSLMLTLLISVPLFLVGVLRPGILVGVYGAEGQMTVLGEEYVRIVFAGAPMFAIISVAASSFIASGNTRLPMVVNGITNLVNIIGNYVLIFGVLGFPALGVRGAALGTLISILVGAAIYLALMVRKNREVRLRVGYFSPDAEMMVRIFRVGAPAGGEQLAIQVAFLVYMTIVVHFGDTAVAAHSIGMRVQSLSFMPGLGFATAATALTGQYLGKRDPAMAEESGWFSLEMALVVMSTLAALLFVFARPLAEVFIRDEGVVALAVVFIRILALGEPAIAIHFTLSGALRGAGDTRYPLYASTIGLYGVRIPIAVVVGTMTPLGIYGVWLAMITEYYARSAVILLRFRSGKWKEIRV
ncbi:MAG: MATE family efflux transporter [Thermoplasmata archaeon]|nr:MATE family efflux transporter [Thermoplasmata archaeon]